MANALKQPVNGMKVQARARLEHEDNVRYKTLRIIYEGKYGYVVRAYDRKASKEVAIKAIKLEIPNAKNIETAEKNATKLALRELVCLTISNHPNLLKLTDVYVPTRTTGAATLNEIYFVSECMNQSLDKLIHGTDTINQEDVSFIMYQIFCGLNHLHRSNIIHRDLKPANIGISKKHQIKILDFGISRQLMEKMTTDPGTMGYKAPEANKKNIYSEKADIWSCGCIFYEFLTKKRPPFQDEKILKQLETGALEWDEYLDEGLFQYENPGDPRITGRLNVENACDLISSLLVFNPEERYTARQAIDHKYLRGYKDEAELEMPRMNVPLKVMQNPSKELLYDLILGISRELQQGVTAPTHRSMNAKINTIVNK